MWKEIKAERQFTMKQFPFFHILKKSVLRMPELFIFYRFYPNTFGVTWSFCLWLFQKNFSNVYSFLMSPGKNVFHITSSERWNFKQVLHLAMLKPTGLTTNNRSLNSTTYENFYVSLFVFEKNDLNFFKFQV